ncbi:hypothetical protein AAVH_40330 [Aphelenchoides avenae]|nr:hypothetical protein AAVH_40330 [Aphelenchus avenae]
MRLSGRLILGAANRERLLERVMATGSNLSPNQRKVGPCVVVNKLAKPARSAPSIPTRSMQCLAQCDSIKRRIVHTLDAERIHLDFKPQDAEDSTTRRTLAGAMAAMPHHPQHAIAGNSSPHLRFISNAPQHPGASPFSKLKTCTSFGTLTVLFTFAKDHLVQNFPPRII